MVHKDIYRNGNKLSSVTEIKSIIKSFRYCFKRNKSYDSLELWRRDLCQCPKCYDTNKHDYYGKALEKGLCGNILADEISEEAAGLGTSTHDEVENWFKGREPSSLWGKLIVEKLKLAQVKPVLIRPEYSMIDEESGLAGSPDAILEGSWGLLEHPIANYTGPCITDHKVKNSIDALTGMQGAGYRYLLRRKHEVDVPWMLILWAQKKLVTPKVKPLWIDLREWEQPFKDLCGVWSTLNPKRKVTIHA